jgi:hypothetical protein
LTIPVIVALVEQTFCKLKLLKLYLCSTMMQERLTDLATVPLERDMPEKIDYDECIIN